LAFRRSRHSNELNFADAADIQKQHRFGIGPDNLVGLLGSEIEAQLGPLYFRYGGWISTQAGRGRGAQQSPVHKHSRPLQYGCCLGQALR
jgi:hypothetical protein